MSTGDPSTYYGKPNPDQGQHVSSFPIGISGLPTEPYDFSLGEYNMGGEEMGWFKFVGIIVAVLALIALIIYVYMWYSKVNQASSMANAVVRAGTSP